MNSKFGIWNSYFNSKQKIEFYAFENLKSFWRFVGIFNRTKVICQEISEIKCKIQIFCWEKIIWIIKINLVKKLSKLVNWWNLNCDNMFKIRIEFSHQFYQFEIVFCKNYCLLFDCLWDCQENVFLGLVPPGWFWSGRLIYKTNLLKNSKSWTT